MFQRTSTWTVAVCVALVVSSFLQASAQSGVQLKQSDTINILPICHLSPGKSWINYQEQMLLKVIAGNSNCDIILL